MPTDVPILESSRLRLRAHRLDDFEASFAMWQDPAVVRYIGGEPATQQQSWSRLLSYAGLWKILGYGYWLVEERKSCQFLGEIGFANFKRDSQPSIDEWPEAGWGFVSSVHRKGYATEALLLALSWADIHLQTRQTVCLVNPENGASIRVAEKCGYTFWCDGTHRGSSVKLMRRNSSTIRLESGPRSRRLR
jgi:RimJ/RimL family protein N-acetyltransferase